MLLSLLAIFIQPMLHNYDGFACRQYLMHSYSYVFRISIQHLLSRICAISGVWPTTASTIKEEEKKHYWNAHHFEGFFLSRLIFFFFIAYAVLMQTWFTYNTSNPSIVYMYTSASMHISRLYAILLFEWCRFLCIFSLYVFVFKCNNLYGFIEDARI